MVKSSKTAIAVWAVAAVVASLSFGNTAEARQPYVAAFVELYPSLKEVVGKQMNKCAICHDPAKPMDKKLRNEYGKALTEALNGEKNLKTGSDEAAKKKFQEATKKAGEAKNEAGKTFAEIIEAGELPAAK